LYDRGERAAAALLYDNVAIEPARLLLSCLLRCCSWPPMGESLLVRFADFVFWVPSFYWHALCRWEHALVVPAALLFFTPLLLVNARLLWVNRAQVRRVARLGAAALRRRGGRAARRAFGELWEDATSLPSLLLLATGSSLQQAAHRGPWLQRRAARVLREVAALPVAIASSALDALATLRAVGVSPVGLARVVRAAARNAAELPSLLVHSVGLSGLFSTPPVSIVPDGSGHLDSDDEQ